MATLLLYEYGLEGVTLSILTPDQKLYSNSWPSRSLYELGLIYNTCIRGEHMYRSSAKPNFMLDEYVLIFSSLIQE